MGVVTVEEKIVGAYAELAMQAEYLVQRNRPLWGKEWAVIAQWARQIELARQRYNEGQPELAVEALPEF